MKTKTKPTAYGALLAHRLENQSAILELTGMSPDEWSLQVLETGCKLIDVYFQDAMIGNANAMVQRYRAALLYDAKHCFWNWFLNQKVQLDEQVCNLFSLFQHYDDVDSNYKEEYLLKLSQWINDDETHNRLRKFLSQSNTIEL